MNKEDLIKLYQKEEKIQKSLSLFRPSTGKRKLGIKGLVGSAKSIILSAIVSQLDQSQLFVLSDPEQAAYFYNDLIKLWGDENGETSFPILYYPASSKKSYEFEHLDNANVLRRTEVSALLQEKDKTCWVVTYPQALTEKVISVKVIEQNTLKVKIGDVISQDFLVDYLSEYDFDLVDFVTQAGEYSVRGGIMDIFSYAHEKPYRIEFYGEEVGSIRSFDIVSQLSHQILKEASILPNVQKEEISHERTSFFEYLGPYAHIWMENVAWSLDILQQSYLKAEESYLKRQTLISQLPPKEFYLQKEEALAYLDNANIVEFGNQAYYKHHASIEFEQMPQPPFNKQFDHLVSYMQEGVDHGMEYFILSENPKQIQRLERVFFELSGDRPVRFTPLNLALYQGFIDKQLKIACFTDHQIFERYHKHIVSAKNQEKAMLSLQDLYKLKPGDYISHIDHGVGRFAGLQKVVNNGKEQEAICIVYKDNDTLHISIHSLHKISKYSGKEGAEPTLNRLGSNAWTNLKNKTKQKVKDIAKDLIKLYAQRKEVKGFAYSADSYLQNELESSFFYEDTPDQYKATQDVKRDMESGSPMDRLVCGDVGFGKTEIAIRAAFKAVADSKQVAVLVPTTILAYQHYKTFTERLQGLPCTVDYINRFRTGKEKTEILKRLKEGKIDILIGTHRIVSKDIVFKDLGLLVIDEEQKIGVAIKEKLKHLKVNLDTLTLTATPIPRTLQFSLMGARDLSVINTPPPNRFPVHTEVHSFSKEILRDAIINELNRGGQVFFVHHRVQNIVEVASMIKDLIPEANIGIAHGQMDGDKLEEVLLGFIEGEFDILVSTKIVENGLDIPNANTIIVNEAQTYGLSELHQLRGRVGRSNKKAFCYLFAPEAHLLSEDAKKRLRVIEEHSEIGSGFQIAMRDLDIRGAGNILGGEQSGFISEIGYEMYQRILEEAMQELKEKEFKGLFEETLTRGAQDFTTKECVVEFDLEALIPSDYVENMTERLFLYKQLDTISSEEELQNFTETLQDRFGKIPPATVCLIKSMQLRMYAKKLGLERLVLKNNTLLITFFAQEESDYFESEIFGRIIQYVQEHPADSRLKEYKSKLSVEFSTIKNMEMSIGLLKSLLG